MEGHPSHGWSAYNPVTGAELLVPKCSRCGAVKSSAEGIAECTLPAPAAGGNAKNAEFQTLLRFLEAQAFNFGKELSDIKANVRVESLIVKPSEACKSNPENISTFNRLLECLHLEYSHDLTLVAVDGDVSEACPWPNHTHNWTAARRSEAETSQVEVAKVDDVKVEKASYEPLVTYLSDVAKLTARKVPNGTSLPNRLLFDMFVYTLKTDIRLRSKVLRVTGDEPRSKFHLMGRTDVVILIPGSVAISRQTVCVAVEVKPEGFNVKEGLREAFLQLIGLNVANEIRSSSVILTNLAQTHFVLYLECVDPIKLRFKLVVRKYTAFNQALWMAMSLKDLPCSTKHFGAAPTPESSIAECESEEGDLIEGFDNVKVEDAR